MSEAIEINKDFEEAFLKKHPNGLRKTFDVAEVGSPEERDKYLAKGYELVKTYERTRLTTVPPYKEAKDDVVYIRTQRWVIRTIYLLKRDKMVN